MVILNLSLLELDDEGKELRRGKTATINIGTLPYLR